LSTARPAETYARLVRRNRAVAILRVGVPILGAVVLAGLMVQIYVSSLTARFEIGQVSITPDAISIAAPEYVGLLEDGSAYRVWATTARAATGSSHLIDLFEAHVVVDRIDGVQLRASAEEAQLDTVNRLTLVPGLAEISDSTGTAGTLTDSVFDWDGQTLTARGPVDIDNADGSTVKAEGLVYDAAAIVWTFERSIVTLPATPGDASGESSQ
jgi:hypothetical protein